MRGAWGSVSIALIACFAKILLPAGFMPGAAAGALAFSLVVCKGDGLTAAGDRERGQAPAPWQKNTHTPCVFYGSMPACEAPPELQLAALSFDHYQPPDVNGKTPDASNFAPYFSRAPPLADVPVV